MGKTSLLVFAVLVNLFLWIPAHAQSETSRKDYKVINQDYTVEAGKGVSILEYDFKGFKVKTYERYFSDRGQQDEGLAIAAKNHTGCGKQTEIYNISGIEIGRKIVCEDKLSKTYTIIYSHFDLLNKVNVISGGSQRIVEEFVQGICPYAYHLYPYIECPGSD